MKKAIKDITTEELIKQLAEEQKKVHGFGFSRTLARAKNVKECRGSKKLIASLKTELAKRA